MAGNFNFFYFMSKQKSWGGSTKSTSLFFGGSPARPEPKEVGNQELSFLLLKNKELQERTLRMGEYMVSMENEYASPYEELNQRYIQTLNQQFRGRHEMFDEEMKKVKKNSHALCKHCNKAILVEFEKDYRNLVKHCMSLGDEIISKNQDLQIYQSMRRQLLEAKHDSVSELVEELAQITRQLVQYKKESNRLQFQNQKIKREIDKIKKGNWTEKNDIEKMMIQNENYRSLINSIQNESIDTEHRLKQKIYSQGVTIEKLEKEVRDSQQQARNIRKQSEEVRVQHIQLISRQEPGGFGRSKSVAMGGRGRLNFL